MSSDGVKTSINRWAEADRPREKMMAHGPQVLSDAELFAILIGSGSAQESAVDLMRRVLASYHNDLGELCKASTDELCEFKGIGPAKALAIQAAAEIGRRRRERGVADRPVISSSSDLYYYFYDLLCDNPIEECWVLFLNQSNRVLDRVRISMGGITAVSVDIRCVLREALLRRAVSVVLCHNHPSGSAQPSAHDDRLTHQLVQACNLLQINLIDHIVFTEGSYYSYADEGRL